MQAVKQNNGTILISHGNDSILTDDNDSSIATALNKLLANIVAPHYTSWLAEKPREGARIKCFFINDMSGVVSGTYYNNEVLLDEGYSYLNLYTMYWTY